MTELTPRQNEALRLRDSGLSYDQVAASMGVTRAAVSMHLSRARRKLGIACGPSRWRPSTPMTAVQHAYLDAFDADLRANRWQSPRSRELLDLMLAEAGVEPEGRQAIGRGRKRATHDLMEAA